MLIISVTAFGVMWWHRASEYRRCYARVLGGMTLDQVRQIMGGNEDEPDERETETGEFERSWTFAANGARITVVFDKTGRSTYTEHGPSGCGVTPLMDKYISKE